MTIVPHIHRNCTFALSKENAVIQMLNRDFRQMELTRVKGSDMAQSSAITLLCSSEIPERAVNKGKLAPMFAAIVPQVVL